MTEFRNDGGIEEILSKIGFALSEEKLIGNDGIEYGDYFIICK